LTVPCSVAIMRHGFTAIRRSNTWYAQRGRLANSNHPRHHHHATFTVKESDDQFSVALQSDDGETRVQVSGTITDQLPSSSVFSSVAGASEFFELGSLGYSVTQTHGRFDGLELRCDNLHVQPLAIDRVESSYFENESRFPRGSVEFDCALLMRGIHHEWHSRKDLCCPETRGACTAAAREP